MTADFLIKEHVDEYPGESAKQENYRLIIKIIGASQLQVHAQTKPVISKVLHARLPTPLLTIPLWLLLIKPPLLTLPPL